jgi:hypothetical protein
MVCGNTLEPTITKAFQITLPTGETKPITKVTTEPSVCVCEYGLCDDFTSAVL